MGVELALELLQQLQVLRPMCEVGHAKVHEVPEAVSQKVPRAVQRDVVEEDS